MKQKFSVGSTVINFGQTAVVVGYHPVTLDPILCDEKGVKWLADSDKCVLKEERTTTKDYVASRFTVHGNIFRLVEKNDGGKTIETDEVFDSFVYHWAFQKPGGKWKICYNSDIVGAFDGSASPEVVAHTLLLCDVAAHRRSRRSIGL